MRLTVTDPSILEEEVCGLRLGDIIERAKKLEKPLQPSLVGISEHLAQTRAMNAGLEFETGTELQEWFIFAAQFALAILMEKGVVAKRLLKGAKEPDTSGHVGQYL